MKKKGYPVQKILIIFVCILLCFWTLFPFLWYFLTSLTVPGSIPRSIRIPDVITLRTYKAVVSKGYFLEYGSKISILPNILNSFIVTSLAVFICLSISIGASYVFSRFNHRKKIIRMGFDSLLIIRMTPGVSLAVPIFLLMSGYKLIDKHIGLALVHSLLSLPLAVWLIKGFFDTIPFELEEQAYIDGATLPKTLFRIILPLAAPGIAVAACFIFLLSYNEFMFALILSRGTINTLPVAIAGLKSEHQAFYNEMAAASFISMIPLWLFFYFTGRYMVRGLSMGALK